MISKCYHCVNSSCSLLAFDCGFVRLGTFTHLSVASRPPPPKLVNIPTVGTSEHTSELVYATHYQYITSQKFGQNLDEILFNEAFQSRCNLPIQLKEEFQPEGFLLRKKSTRLGTIKKLQMHTFSKR